MTNRPTRRGLAAGAVALPATFFIGAAQAQSSPESTLDRITRTKQLRMAVVSGSPPYFKKDVATGAWAGAAVEMAKSIAAIWGAEVVYVESTWGNSVLDVQSNKIDIAFALNPTPQRALAIGFTRPYIVAPFGCLAKPGFDPEDLGRFEQARCSHRLRSGIAARNLRAPLRPEGAAYRLQDHRRLHPRAAIRPRRRARCSPPRSA